MTLGVGGFLWVSPILAFLPLLGLWIRARRLARVERYLTSHPGAELWPVGPESPQLLRFKGIRALLLISSGLLLALALSQPRVGTHMVPVPAPGASLVILLDVSPSMAVEDVPGGRLAAAKLVARRALGEVPEVPLVLGAYAGDPHLLLPSTTDRDLFLTTVDALNPSVLPFRGSRLAPALAMVRGEAREVDGSVGVLVLSDGEDHGLREEALVQAGEIRRKGGWVSTVAVGRPPGGRVPGWGATGAGLMPGAPGAEAEEGLPVSIPEPEFLQRVADAGGGPAVAWDSPEEMAELMAFLEAWNAREGRGVTLEEMPLEAWPFFLAMAVTGFFLEGLLGLDFRRKATRP